MKRSDINAAIDRAVAFFREMRFPLPPFAFWTPEDWAGKGPDCDEIRSTRLGWDVTDFGSGDFPRVGRTIFTLRNGSVRPVGRVRRTSGRRGLKAYPKSYAQKVMCLAEGQRSPVHFHRSKTEDIVNQGGGCLRMTLWRAADDDTLSDEPLVVFLDGVRRRVSAGETLRLGPGESVCVTPRTYHQFWGEEGPVGRDLRPSGRRGTGATLSVEVSSVCDDLSDNFFLERGERFPGIEEDEPRRFVLCSEYG